MITREYLKQIAWYEWIIENKKNELKELDEIVYNISSQNIGEKVQNSYKTDKTANAAIRITTQKEKIEQIIADCIDKKSYIINQIDSIKNINIHKIMILKYVKNLSNEEIIKATNYSKAQMLRLHKQGLLEFEKRFGQEYLEKCS